jgi:hypothetical protein
VHIETDAAPDLEPPRVVDGRTLVKAGLRPPPPAAIGLDKGPAIDKSRCREIEGQERAASLTPVRPTTKRDAKPLFAKEKMIAQVRSAIRLRDSGKGKRLTRLTGEQNQKERTFDVLPKPANLISYRQKFVERLGSYGRGVVGDALFAPPETRSQRVRESIGESSQAQTSGPRARILRGMRSLETRLSVRCEPGAISVRTISSPASSDPRDGNNPAGPKAIEIGGLSRLSP